MARMNQNSLPNRTNEPKAEDKLQISVSTVSAEDMDDSTRSMDLEDSQLTQRLPPPHGINFLLSETSDEEHYGKSTAEYINSRQEALRRPSRIILTFCTIAFMVFCGFGIVELGIWQKSRSTRESLTLTMGADGWSLETPTSTLHPRDQLDENYKGDPRDQLDENYQEGPRDQLDEKYTEDPRDKLDENYKEDPRDELDENYKEDLTPLFPLTALQGSLISPNEFVTPPTAAPSSEYLTHKKTNDPTPILTDAPVDQSSTPNTTNAPLEKETSKPTINKNPPREYPTPTERNATLQDPPCDDVRRGTYLTSSSQYNSWGDMRVPIPPDAREGDLLVLFLSRTDDVLPLELEGWTTGPSCLKEHNGQQKCWTLEDCLKISESYHGEKFCSQFPKNHTGEDLATVVFYKTVVRSETIHTVFDWPLPGYHPAWAIIVSIRGADNLNPIRSTSGASCDRSKQSVFPSVRGEPGDLLLLSMAFDDASSPDNFEAPNGTVRINHAHGSDEAGFLFGKRLKNSGKTRKYKTEGEGGSGCKDALLSVVIRTIHTDHDTNKSNILSLKENSTCADRR